MRNRANTPPRNENDFILGGSAGIDGTPAKTAKPAQKAKPVSISLTDENHQSIDNIIKNEAMNGNSRVNRSDVVRAAILSIEKLSKEEISSLIQQAKMK